MFRLTIPPIGDDEIQACVRVLREGQLVHGEECRLFEQELAEYIGVKEAVVVSSGTAALHLALIALGIGPGHAVLVPDFTFPATANVVELVGARPVFIDVNRGNYNMSVDLLRDAIRTWQGPETLKAIMPVHEFGCPADMTAINSIALEHNLSVVEDAACALGASLNGKKIGSFGDCACFSFHPRKTLTTGEGGAIATNNPKVAERLRLLRSHGMQPQKDGIHFMLPGYNYRLTNFQAAMARVQLKKLDDWIEERRQIQAEYRRLLTDCSRISVPVDCDGHSWQTFMTVIDPAIDRNRVMADLKEAGIETNLGAQCVHSQDYYLHKYPDQCELLGHNNAHLLFRCGLALPLYQGLAKADLTNITDCLKRVL